MNNHVVWIALIEDFDGVVSDTKQFQDLFTAVYNEAKNYITDEEIARKMGKEMLAEFRKFYDKHKVKGVPDEE